MANEDQEHTDVPFYTHLIDKKSDNTKHLRGCGSTGSLNIANVGINWYSHFGKQCDIVLGS